MEMTAEEICRNYLQAADPASQVGILADLNMTNKDEIKRILENCGISVKVSNRRGRASCVWTAEREKQLVSLVARGFRQKDIAKELGIARSTVSQKLSQIKKCPAVAGTTAGRG